MGTKSGDVFRMTDEDDNKPFFEHDGEERSGKKQEEKWHLKCKILRESAAAVLVLFDQGGEAKQDWIPLSQIHSMTHDPRVIQGYGDTIIMTAWIAKKKGLYV